MIVSLNSIELVKAFVKVVLDSGKVCDSSKWGLLGRCQFYYGIVQP